MLGMYQIPQNPAKTDQMHQAIIDRKNTEWQERFEKQNANNTNKYRTQNAGNKNSLKRVGASEDMPALSLFIAKIELADKKNNK